MRTRATTPANDQPNGQADDEAQSEGTTYEQHDGDDITHGSTRPIQVRSIPRTVRPSAHFRSGLLKPLCDLDATTQNQPCDVRLGAMGLGPVG